MGTETFEREKDLSILEQVEAELGDIEHAIRRLDDGTYGTCEVCGRPIDDARLEALPATRLCLDHQAEAERDVRVAGMRPGPARMAADGEPASVAADDARGPGQAPGPG
jgi:RNA polymerase-binding transcription factor DksA